MSRSSIFKSVLQSIFCFVAAMTLLFVSPEAQAFTLIRSGSNVTATGWSSSNVTFDIDSSCNSYFSATSSAIDRAADVWGRVPTSSLQVARGTTVTLSNPITTYVGASASSYAPAGNAIVYCDSSFATHSGLDADSIPGFATGQNISSSGSIDGCLLVLNVQSGALSNITTLSTSTVDVILTHEIGHCLGLGHSSDTNALMYYATGAGRGAYLSRDDIDGISYLYPKQELSSSFPGCSAVAGTLDQPLKKPGGRGPWSQIGPWLISDLLFGLIILALLRLVFKASKRRRKLDEFSLTTGNLSARS